ncbi:uncharacterized protein TNCV_4609771 [Trichonephila clavipes]|nr:uncharacterized protein TNCV_4609771 [Trichonephila clavipes]
MKVPQAIEKVLVSKSKQVQMLSVDPDGVTQPVTVEEEKGLSNALLISAEDETYEEKGKTPVDVIKDKAEGDVDPIILSKQRVDLDDEAIEELPKRKLKKLSRMTVDKLQQKVNLKASSNIVLIPQHWDVRYEYSQDKRGEKLAGKLPNFIKRTGVVKVRPLLPERDNCKTTKVKGRKQVRLKLKTYDTLSTAV